MATIDIKLKKINKIYKQGETISGFVVVNSLSDITHQGINLTLDGSVSLQLSAKSVGMFEAFYNSIKPMKLIGYMCEIAKPGKMPSGKVEIPFNIVLTPKSNKILYETYHGVFVNIQYILKAEMKRSMLNKDLSKQCEFVVEQLKDLESIEDKAVPFSISPETLTNLKDTNVPNFKVTGHLNCSSINITKPLEGELMVENCDAPIKSIELQLVRVETCGCAEGYAKDATEIQNIQIADGNVCRGVPIPIFMIFPRLFTCPTLSTNNFKIEFEVNVVIVFSDDHLVTENFPIRLLRTA